jgi:hypothetical protein
MKKQRNLNLDDIHQSLRNPVLIDNSKTVQSANNNNVTNGNKNIKSSESFQVFFPNGSMSPLTDGQDSLEKFQQLVQAATENGYDLALQSSIMKEAITDEAITNFKDNNLVNACLLQFPYGRGGMHEQRRKVNGSFTCDTDITKYAEHLS